MEYLGNKDLLNVPKTAFLASSTIPPDMVLKCYDWATQMAKEGKCVVSGFSSHLEREVLHFLAKGKQPIILVLARGMYKQIPENSSLYLMPTVCLSSPFPKLCASQKQQPTLATNTSVKSQIRLSLLE